ncbi:Phenylalanine--tRNA ligase alpha subunit [Dirofilaria immitis]|nr:Phenylalanine--tRNA ligase alpha subunit [Dirofilaria immitis]
MQSLKEKGVMFNVDVCMLISRLERAWVASAGRYSKKSTNTVVLKERYTPTLKAMLRRRKVSEILCLAFELPRQLKEKDVAQDFCSTVESSSDRKKIENNYHRRPLSYRYPVHQRKNKEENGRQMNRYETVVATDTITISEENTWQNGVKIGKISNDIRYYFTPVHTLFGDRGLKVRFRGSFFPFTEHSIKVDISYKDNKWIEVLGCSMVHRNVFRSVGIDPMMNDAQPNATMETRVAGQGQPKRVGRWTLAQLRQTDGIIPSQAGWNKGDSQKLMTNFGTPRNTQTKVKSENLAEIPEEILMRTHGEVRLQSGTNKFESQRGMTGFGTGRDVCREGVHVNQAPSDLQPLEEEKFASVMVSFVCKLGMTGFGTARRETTKMKDSRHPDYDHERPDQSEIPLQAGTNKFASQKGMTGFGTSRRETTKICDSAHPEYDPESSIDSSTIPSQMGSNKYASQKGMTGFGQPRWEVLDPSISWQNRKSQGMVRLQSGTNRFASQQGMTGFGTPRNTTYEAEAGELPYEDMKKSETVIPSQAGWNRGDSQKGMTGFGAPRDVKGKHLKRIWELEYPEEAEASSIDFRFQPFSHS